jgi:cytochrome c553
MRPLLNHIARSGWLLAFALSMAAATAEEPKSGEQIYKSLCIRCHGASGQGDPVENPKPLAGDKSIEELARLIDKTMPDGEPEKCDAAESQRVAEYIYGAFYSPAAQARNQPPRVELSRLTVRQYQNALADLVGSFREPARWGSERGLKGDYSKSGRRGGGGRRRGSDGAAFSRVDPQVKFDFGESSPDPEKIPPEQFGIRWEGSLLAPETGEYEFIVRTEQSARLYVNDLRQPLIDALIKSGNDTEYRGAIRLLGGRVYPLRLEFSKSKQGVDDSKTKKPMLGKASISLEWKLPHLPPEVIPARCLSPERTSEIYVVGAPFPPDDRSVGYERGTSISKAWDQATTDGTIETTGYVLSRLSELAGVNDDAPDRAAWLREFCRKFAERAFRRPLSDELRRVYVDQHFEAAENPEAAVKHALLLVLKSPRFLYRELGGSGGDGYDVASRLSFAMWDSVPDDELLRAAAEGKLATKEEVLAQAERMVGDLRTRAKVRQFFQQWLRIEQVPDLAKAPDRYPEFTEEVAADLRTSLDLFLEEVIWGGRSDFRDLLLAEAVPMNGRLSGLYGGDLAADSPFTSVPLKEGDRAGLLSHPYLLAAFAYTENSSPIHRGVFISRSLLGRSLRPPPEAVTPLAPELHAELTTRERVELQTKSEACMSCHGMINPLGFTLEHYDAIGRHRSLENGKPIDARGSYLTRSGETVRFGGIRELAKFLAESDEAHSAFVEQLFHHLVKQPVRAYGPRTLAELKQAFGKNEYSIRQLVAQIAARAAVGPEAAVP